MQLLQGERTESGALPGSQPPDLYSITFSPETVLFCGEVCTKTFVVVVCASGTAARTHNNFRMLPLKAEGPPIMFDLELVNWEGEIKV
jgi:hypothetical protein